MKGIRIHHMVVGEGGEEDEGEEEEDEEEEGIIEMVIFIFHSNVLSTIMNFSCFMLRFGSNLL